MPRTKKSIENEDTKPQENTAGTKSQKNGAKNFRIDYVPGVTQLEDVINQINKFFNELL